MSELEALRWLGWSLGVSLLVQTLEFFRLQRDMSSDGVWVWDVLRKELPKNAPNAIRFFDFLFDRKIHWIHLSARLLAVCGLLLLGPSLWLMVFLFLSHVALLFRFRGAFNGGSDFLSLVVITGLLLSELTHEWSPLEWGYRAGFWYITLHTVSSYFISGWVKLKRPEWRDGSALVMFLDGGIYGPLSPKSLFRLRGLAVLCSWSFIVWWQRFFIFWCFGSLVSTDSFGLGVLLFPLFCIALGACPYKIPRSLSKRFDS